MNDKDIYSAIGESFDDKIKLDFDDVKKRIAALENTDSAVITPITPSSNRKKVVFAIVSAAACLAFIIGISSIAAFNGGMAKSDAKSEAYMMYDSTSAYVTADDAAYSAESTDYFDYECTIEESFECNESSNSSDFAAGTYGEFEPSESDVSSTDILSSTDIN